MINELKNFGDVLEDVSLVEYNTYKIGGTCKYMVSPKSANDIVNLKRFLKDNEVKYFLLGNGSNIVLSSKYFDGVVINFKNMNGFAINNNDSTLYAEAGAMLPKIVRESVNSGLKGLEFAANIPGTVGGSIVGNAGAHSCDIMDYVSEITVVDELDNLVVYKNEDIEYHYRYTSLKERKDCIIVSAKFQLSEGDKESSIAIIKERSQKRLESQPLEYPSAGSVFRNPTGDFAGRLVEACNLKGYRIGGASVSSKHANFVVNDNNAKSEDVYELINLIHRTVLAQTGVDLKIEQEFIGWD